MSHGFFFRFLLTISVLSLLRPTGVSGRGDGSWVFSDFSLTISVFGLGGGVFALFSLMRMLGLQACPGSESWIFFSQNFADDQRFGLGGGFFR